MYRLSFGHLASCGLVLGALCSGGQGNAQEPGGPNWPSAGGRSARSAQAPRRAPEGNLGQTAAEPPVSGIGSQPDFSRATGSRTVAPQPTPPTGPLVALKSGPQHTRMVCRLQWLPAADVRATISELLRQEAEISGSAGT